MNPVPYATVPRLWPGSTIVCVAGGPSLMREDVDACRGRARVIAINEAIRLAPWADVCYAHHAEEWDRWAGLPAFQGLKYAYEPEAARWPGVQVLRCTGPHGLERDPSAIRHGFTSAYQAVNVAVHLGAARIVLLGYDMQLGPHGELHWHAGGDVRALPFGYWVEAFATLVEPLAAAGVEVVNCTRRTALRCFPVAMLEETLALDTLTSSTVASDAARSL